MPQSIRQISQLDRRRQEWIDHVIHLADEISAWAAAERWEVVRTQKTVVDKTLGTYDVPEVQMKLPHGELHLDPIGVHWEGARGQLRLEAIPTLSKIRLVEASAAGGWEIIAGANIPLRRPWSRETFVQLADDLLTY